MFNNKNNSYSDRKKANIDIFYETMSLIKKDNGIAQNTLNSIKGQKVFLENDLVDISKNNGYNTQVIVSKEKTLEASKKYNGKVAILNFASSTNPGGGVTKGSSAQEECICRCTNLYPCLEKAIQEFYVPHRSMNNPLYNDDIIYTPNICVLRDDNNEDVLLRNNEQYKVDVITCAAPNLRAKPSNYMNPNAGNKPASITNDELFELLKKRISRIFEVAIKNEVDVLILGAFGCGAFCNPPHIVAKAFKYCIEKYNGYFKNIEFAIYCPPGKEENFNAFYKIFI